MNPLTNIPAVWRRRVYVAFALVGVVVGTADAGGFNVGTVPAMLGYLSVALGITAASNTDVEVPETTEGT